MSLLPRLDAGETPHLPCLDGQVWFPGVIHRAIKRHQKVRMQSWRTARGLVRLGSTGRSEQTINCEKISRTCQMNTHHSSTVTVSRRKCSRWMMSKLPYWQPKGNSYTCKVGSKNFRITWSASLGRLRRNDNNRLEILQKWIEADQELDAAHAKQVQCRFWWLNKPQKTRRLYHPLSVQIFSLDAKHGLPQRCGTAHGSWCDR